MNPKSRTRVVIHEADDWTSLTRAEAGDAKPKTRNEVVTRQAREDVDAG